MIFPEKLYKAYLMCSKLGWSEDRRGKVWYGKFIRESEAFLKKLKKKEPMDHGWLVVQLAIKRLESEDGG